jgi:hypothetical protein
MLKSLKPIQTAAKYYTATRKTSYKTRLGGAPRPAYDFIPSIMYTIAKLTQLSLSARYKPLYFTLRYTLPVV